jgi:hypothetical protein
MSRFHGKSPLLFAADFLADVNRKKRGRKKGSFFGKEAGHGSRNLSMLTIQ